MITSASTIWRTIGTATAQESRKPFMFGAKNPRYCIPSVTAVTTFVYVCDKDKIKTNELISNLSITYHDDLIDGECRMPSCRSKP